MRGRSARAEWLTKVFGFAWLAVFVVAPLLVLVDAALPFELREVERAALLRSLARGAGLSVIAATGACALGLALARVVAPALLVGLLLVSRTLVAHGVLGLGLEPGASAAVLTLILDLAAFVALIVGLRLRTRPQALIDAARDLGAGRTARLRTIEWPHMRPALLAAWAWALLQSLGDVIAFETAGGGHGYTPGLLIRDALVREDAPARGLAAVLALLVLALPSAWMLTRELVDAQRGDWRPPPPPGRAVTVIGWLALGLCVLAPARAVFGPPHGLGGSAFGVVDRQLAELALWSFGLAGVVALVAGGLGFGLALLDRRSEPPTWLSFAVLAPLAIPPSVLGLLALGLARGLGVAPGPGLTIVALLGPAVTLAFIAARLLLATIPRALVDAARDLGATAIDRLRTLWLPLGRPALLVAVLVAFAWALGQAAIPSFTSGPGGDTLAVALTIHARAGSMAVVRRWSLVLVALPVITAAAVHWAGRGRR